MNSSLTDKFIDDLYNLTQVPPPQKVIKQVKKCILDYLGVTLAGSKMLEEKGNILLDYFGLEKGNITVIGFNRKTTLQNAILVNGLSSHIAELDDGHRFGMVHPGAPVISALLPLAQYEKIKAKDLFLGIIIGYEAVIRLSTAIQPSHKEQGYHATGTCGTIGAALGIASALNFTKQEMRDAFSAAVTVASGCLEVIEGESELKPLNVASASVNGLVAAFMAKSGFAGPSDALGGKRGFLSIMSKEENLSYLTKKQGEKYGIEKIYMKPYAACRHCHPAIEAAIKIRTKYNVAIDDIEEIKVDTYKLAFEGHEHTNIQGMSSAKMSIPYSVAIALAYGKAGINEFMAENIQNRNIISLTNKVEVFIDEELTALVPHKRGSIVKVTTKNRECYVERVDYPKGEPENPISDEELKRKFISLSMYGKKTRDDSLDIIKIVENLENDLFDLFDLL